MLNVQYWHNIFCLKMFYCAIENLKIYRCYWDCQNKQPVASPFKVYTLNIDFDADNRLYNEITRGDLWGRIEVAVIFTLQRTTIYFTNLFAIIAHSLHSRIIKSRRIRTKKEQAWVLSFHFQQNRSVYFTIGFTWIALSSTSPKSNALFPFLSAKFRE